MLDKKSRVWYKGSMRMRKATETKAGIKFIRISCYNSSEAQARFVFFSSGKQLEEKWYFPFSDFNLKDFLSVYPELNPENVEVISPPDAHILVCNYPEVDKYLCSFSSELDFDAERFFRPWKGEINEIEWKTPDCELVCNLSWVGKCPHPEGCPYKYPYFHTDFAVVVLPKEADSIWCVSLEEYKKWKEV